MYIFMESIFKKNIMKKVLLGSGFALLALVVLSSCKKEYTCTCSTGLSGTITTETNKGKDATDACDDLTSVLELKACVPA